MAEPNSLNFRFSTKVRKIGFIFPILFAILISMILVQLILLVKPCGEKTVFPLQGFFETSILLNLLVVAILFASVLFILFRVCRIRKDIAAKILIAIFIETGMLSVLLFGKLVFNLLGLESPVFLIFVAVVAYIGTYFAFLTFVDALSQNGRNRLFVISSGSLGAFLGILIPTLYVVGISIILAIVDVFLVQSRFFERIVGEAEYEKMIIEMAFSTKEWGIGIGDLICYSMIVSSTLANYGILTGGLSLILILVGALFTIKLVEKRRRVPGLPISTALGLLPSIIFLIFY